MKLHGNIHHVSWHCWKDFRGQRSMLQRNQMHFCCRVIYFYVVWHRCSVAWYNRAARYKRRATNI